MLPHTIKVLQSISTTLAEGGKGVMGTPFVKQPEKALQLYDLEGSPFCRRVREVLTLLNLDVEIYPCPKGGQKYRNVVQQKGGKQLFPFFIDHNTNVQLYESQDIINYLFKQYGKTGKVPKKYQHLSKLPLMGFAGTILSGIRGVKVNKHIINRPAPEKLLELWSFEASPFSRLVREELTELELPYILHNVAKERWQDMGMAKLRLKPGKYEPLAQGKREKQLEIMQGKMQVPYLYDPNTDTRLFESSQIIKYLRKFYAK